MKKILTVSLLASSVLFADTLAGSFENGEVSGQIRAGYISLEPESGGDNDAFALGGHLKYETGSYYGLKAGVGFYTSHSLGINDPDRNGDFFDSNSNSFSILGESYLSYSANSFSISTGRMLLDTPYADTDDIRMMPNMFEATLLSYSGISDLTLLGAYVTKWAGFDAESPDKFIDLADNSDGTIMVAGIYSGLSDTEIGAWYYGVDEVTDILYLDATYSKELENISFEVGAQVANFSESSNSGVDGVVFGVTGAVGFGDLTLSGAYNRASNDDGKSVINGFGGGPYFTSMDEMTIDGLEDAKAYMIGLEYDLSNLTSIDLNIALSYGLFEDKKSTQETKELDIVVASEIAENLEVEAVYASLEDDVDSSNSDFNFDRLLMRVNYNF